MQKIEFGPERLEEIIYTPPSLPVGDSVVGREFINGSDPAVPSMGPGYAFQRFPNFFDEIKGVTDIINPGQPYVLLDIGSNIPYYVCTREALHFKSCRINSENLLNAYLQDDEILKGLQESGKSEFYRLYSAVKSGKGQETQATVYDAVKDAIATTLFQLTPSEVESRDQFTRAFYGICEKKVKIYSSDKSNVGPESSLEKRQGIKYDVKEFDTSLVEFIAKCPIRSDAAVELARWIKNTKRIPSQEEKLTLKSTQNAGENAARMLLDQINKAIRHMLFDKEEIGKKRLRVARFISTDPIEGADIANAALVDMSDDEKRWYTTSRAIGRLIGDSPLHIHGNLDGIQLPQYSVSAITAIDSWPHYGNDKNMSARAIAQQLTRMHGMLQRGGRMLIMPWSLDGRLHAAGQIHNHTIDEPAYSPYELDQAFAEGRRAEEDIERAKNTGHEGSIIVASFSKQRPRKETKYAMDSGISSRGVI